MPKSFKGKIKARVVKVRFAVSGKTSNVTKVVGDTVKKGELLASLDRKILQTQLDRELADFERVRADFEIFSQKNPDPKGEIDKYLKKQKQAILDASVKDVEIAKARLDRSDLLSPVDGVVLDDANLVRGVNITPSSASLEVVDTNSFYFELVVEQEDISFFEKERSVSVKIEGMGKVLKGKSGLVVSDGKKLLVRIPMENGKGMFLGLNGKANF